MMYRQLSLTNIWFHSTSLRRASPSQGNLIYVKWVHSMGRLLALGHSLMPLDGVQRSHCVLSHRTIVDGLRIGWMPRLEIEEQVDLKINNKEAQKAIPYCCEPLEGVPGCELLPKSQTLVFVCVVHAK